MALTGNETIRSSHVTDIDGRIIVVGPDGVPLSGGGGGGTLNSEGTPDSAFPTKALMVGGSDGTNLRRFATDVNGIQKIDLAGQDVTLAVDLPVSTPTAFTNAGTVASSKYTGISVANSSATANAKVRVRNNNAAGIILDTITLAPNESVSYTYPRGRAAASGTIYMEIVSGGVEGSIFTA